MSIVYLIPSPLADNALQTIAPYILEAIQKCQVIFAENERTTRRFMKALDKSIHIDNYEWHEIHKAEDEQVRAFRKSIKEGKTIGIISEAGCPGIADPGQKLVHAAQQEGCIIKPLVGPSSIILALMASGMNGQQFTFHGYLSIEASKRNKEISEMEAISLRKGSTEIFIETPYRNNQLLEALLNTCKPSTRLCIAWDITSENEKVVTRTIAGWKQQKPGLHKIPAIFLLNAH